MPIYLPDCYPPKSRTRLDHIHADPTAETDPAVVGHEAVA